MRQAFHRLVIATRGRGLIDKTAEICGWVSEQGIDAGRLTIWCRHTSASLLVQENADPDVRRISSGSSRAWRRMTRPSTAIARKARTICRPISAPRLRALSFRFRCRTAARSSGRGRVSISTSIGPRRTGGSSCCISSASPKPGHARWTEARGHSTLWRPGRKAMPETREVQVSENAAELGLHHIVVVGGGAGGLELVTGLGDKLGAKRKARVTLVEKSRTHLWKPMLHAVAAGSLNPGEHEVSYLAQAHWHNFRVRFGQMVGLDREAKEIHLAPTLDDEGREVTPPWFHSL